MVSGHVHASATLLTGRNPRYPPRRGLGELHSRNWRLKEEKILCHCRVSVHDLWSSPLPLRNRILIQGLLQI